MSQSNIAISVRNLAKAYTIAHNQEKHVTLAEAMLARLRHPFRRQDKETFWALRDISFDVQRGEVVGIIGRNGAGKSTLLKILSRITQPTNGRIELFGRVGSLLEVGTGFHPELTGRENIFLNGAILGMTKAEIRKQFDAIVDFAGVENFIDTPVKRYSSGMYVRLAFAVAAHLNPEILIIDEVLAVGDLEFQKKCLGKMKDVATSGRTVLFVSHHMQSVQALCNRGMFLEQGQVSFIGSAGDAIDKFMQAFGTPAAAAQAADRRPGSGEMRFTSFAADKNLYKSGDEIVVEMEVTDLTQTQPSYFVSLEVATATGLTVLHLDSRLLNMEFAPTPTRRLRFTIGDARLAKGDYTINAYLCGSSGIIDVFERASEFTISPLMPYPAIRGDCVGKAMVYPRLNIEDLSEKPLRIDSADMPATPAWPSAARGANTTSTAL
jgi:lipopolysaccharide transport system ATP-binding protein